MVLTPIVLHGKTAIQPLMTIYKMVSIKGEEPCELFYIFDINVTFLNLNGYAAVLKQLGLISFFFFLFCYNTKRFSRAFPTSPWLDLWSWDFNMWLHKPIAICIVLETNFQLNWDNLCPYKQVMHQTQRWNRSKGLWSDSDFRMEKIINMRSALRINALSLI